LARKRYCAAPAVRSAKAPAHTFARPGEAVRYARVAAEVWGVAYAVWRVRRWRLRILRRVPPPPPWD
jgi:hypothetical protein